jgi:hypothetical protein
MPKAWLAALLLLTLTFIVTEPLFNFIDDEVTIVNDASTPARSTMARFVEGTGQHEHPPLFDLTLHFWLIATRGRMGWLRIPSILSYVAGLAALAIAAMRLGSPGSGLASSAATGSVAFFGEGTATVGQSALWVGVLWPFGFHFGRVAAWYAFSFALVSLLTLVYLDFLRAPGRDAATKLVIVATALLYTSYYGWAIVACLVVDFILTARKDWKKRVRWVSFLAAALILIYAPMWKAFFAEVFGVVGVPRPKGLFLGAAFCLYSLFVSESVAPWYWWAGVPLAFAVLACVILTFIWSSGLARRFLIYFLVLFAGMDVLGILGTKRLLLISPWLLIPIGVALGKTTGARRRTLAGLLAVVFLAGWIGIGLRKYYSAPRWVEPWQQVAASAAQSWRNGAMVMSNSPAFFLYLSYDLGLAGPPQKGFRGFLPEAVKAKNIYEIQEWLGSGRAAAGEVVLVRGVEFSAPGIAEEAEASLEARCGPAKVTDLDRDPGYELKQRFFPVFQQPAWRIEVREYACAAGLNGSRRTSSSMLGPNWLKTVLNSDPPVLGALFL